MESITITNSRICNFYSKHKHINIETMNLILLDLLENLTLDMNSLLQDTIESQILSEIKDVKLSLNTLYDSLRLNLNENNKSFIETIKLIISVHGTEQYDKFSSVLQQSIDTYIDKMYMILPKSNEENNKHIQEYFTLLHKNIQSDILQFMANKNDSNITEFIQSFDSKLINLQQPLYTIIHSNQKQITENISTIHSNFNELKVNSDKVHTEMTQYLNKYKNSAQHKGQMAELNIEEILNAICPTDEIINTTSQTSTGDFILKRDNKEFIMFENKCYTNNVDKREVEKFYVDINKKKLHSIMISNTSGIVGKSDFTIEINKDGCIIIFLTHVNFCPTKIKSAIKIIENLSPKLKQITENNKDSSIEIEKEIMDRINEEYMSFIDQKNSFKEILKEQLRTNQLLLDSMNMPDLSILLENHYSNGIIKKCDLCDFTCNSNSKLNGHKLSHTKPISETQRYNSMTLDELRLECDTLGIDHTGIKRKVEIIKLLKSK